MKKLSPLYTTGELERVRNMKPHEIDLRIGYYFRKLDEKQKARFKRIEISIARKLGLKLNQCPIELLLIRQIALNTIRIEEAELYLVNHPEEKWNSKVEKWLIPAQKERRDAIALLSTLSKATEKKEGVDSFQVLRDMLRDEEGLGKSKKINYTPDGHDRRHYDKVVRTKSEEKPKKEPTKKTRRPEI